jgi:AraC family transcriptional regulator
MLAQSHPKVRDYAAASAMAAHVHDEPSFSLVVAGGFEERIGGGARDYARGHLAFVPAGARHAQRFGPRGARQVTVRPPQTWIDYLDDCKLALDSAPHARAEVFCALGDRLLQEIRKADDFSPVACEGLMLELVAAFGRRSRAEAAAVHAPAWLRTAQDFIQAHALTKISLAEIAAACGRHEIHLAREFRRCFGLSVGDQLRRLRTEHAARLLQASRLSLSEIALESGFSSHAHLCREFKLRMGVTPSQYRAQTRL